MRLAVTGLVVQWRAGGRAGPLDLDVGPGVTHLVGPNGSGKTSLLRAIAASLPRASGAVLLDGSDPELEPSVRARIGYVSAQPSLPGFLTVDEAWRLLASARGRPGWDGRALCEAMDLPRGLRLDHASAGTRRKAELIAALAGDPDLLLFDETTALLDDRSRAVLVDWMEGWRTTRILLLAHHGPLPLPADRIVPCPGQVNRVTR